jgi:6-pyruvoyl-tetrahydropterin synthase related domain
MTVADPRLVAAPKRRVPPLLLAWLLSLVVSLTIVSPYFVRGTASGHDFEFHVASWQDVAFQWKEGTIYPRWTALTNHGFGEPRFIFYPPLSWFTGAALVRFIPGTWAVIVFVVLTQTVAGLSAFVLLRRLVGERAALFGALCYAANPNFLLITYIRSDFAEQLACAFFPLLLLSALRVSGLLEDHASHSRKLVAFAVPFAAIWLTNAPAAVIATYTVALLFAWVAFTSRSWRVAARGASGMALGFGLAGFYLVPAVYEQRWVNISQALSSGLLPSQNFIFTQLDDVDHNWFNLIATVCALGVILLCALAALGSGCFGSSIKGRPGKYAVARVLLVLAVVASVLMLRFSAPLWNVLPKLRFVQFPWRWMSMVALFCACFLAFAAERKRFVMWVLAFLILTAPLAALFLNNGWWDPDEMPTLEALVTSGTGFEGTDEYDPLGDDHQDLPVNAPLAQVLPDDSGAAAKEAGKIQVLEWKTEEKKIAVDFSEESQIALRVLNYPAWRVEVNGRRIDPQREDNLNEMVVPVPSGQSLVTVRFTRTWDRSVGILISLLSLLLLAALWFVGGTAAEREARSSNAA